MVPIQEIKSLLDKGEYSRAFNLAHSNILGDHKNICKNLGEIRNIEKTIEDSTALLSSLESRIEKRKLELQNVTEITEILSQVEDEELVFQSRNKNLSNTCNLIDELIENLSIPDQVQLTLFNEKWDDESSVDLTKEALKHLEKVLNYEPDLTLQKLRCFREQKTLALRIKSHFSDRFRKHFVGYVRLLLERFSESFINNIYSQAITMPGHDVIHNHLFYLAPIVHWLQYNDEISYLELKNDYERESTVQYDRELKIFFDCAKERMTNPNRHLGRVSELSSDSRKRNSMTAGESSTRSSSLSGGGTMDTQDAISGKSSEISYTGWDEFDAYIEKILHAIHPTCLSEQRFYTAFFQTFDESGNEVTDPKIIKLFGVLEAEFIEFADFYNSQNGLYSLYMFVRLSHYLRDQNNSHSFLTQIYLKVLIEVKRNFDNFMEQQLSAFRDLKAPKTSKCGVLSAVKNFEQFVTQVESLFKSTGARRTDIDRWYHQLGEELFKAIDRIEHSKTPQEMIRLENYNYLHDVLSRYRSLKVPCLEDLRRKADLQYKEARKAYVTCYFGRPLDKLNKFFEGVEAKLKLGVKEEEISFQLAFSKQELRKVLQQVTLKEVRKGLEEMYRRIEKHAYEPDSNLIQAIWRDMQDEFLSQYKEKQGMIERCYPSSNLSLTFTIDDVIGVFKHIAQSH